MTRILIVEDESIVALDLKRRLKNSGYDIAALANSGKRAIELANQLPLDLILMDIRLDGQMDGIEAAKVIRNQLNLPVIFLTAFTDEETLRRAREAEPFGFIPKPLDENSLVPAIEMALYKHKTELALHESELKYHTLVDTMPDAVFITDINFKIAFCNQQAAKMFEYENHAFLLGTNALDLLIPEHRDLLAQNGQELLETGSDGLVEYTLRKKNGEIFQGELKASLQYDTAGKIKGFVAITRDITERKQLEKQAQDLLEQVQNLARRDSLTNLYNHHYFYEIAGAEFSRSKRYKHPLAAIMADLDHFKLINDTYGHLVGDQVLQEAAEHMQANIRALDTLGRVGGEEFLVILPETTTEEAIIIAERLRSAIEQGPNFVDRTNIRVTASFGIAVMSSDCSNIDDLIYHADQAMYMAKHNGRNRSEVWGPSKKIN